MIVGPQAERRALQLTYRDKRRNDGHVYYDAISDADLELKVERLHDELAELRRAFEASQDEGLAGQKELLSRSAITTEKTRAHLLESVERTHQTALAEAERPRGGDASASAKRPNRPMQAASPASMNWPLPSRRSRVPAGLLMSSMK